MKALVNRELGAQFTNVSQSIVQRFGHGAAAQEWLRSS
jgi:hypothetical protein